MIVCTYFYIFINVAKRPDFASVTYNGFRMNES